jgi:hypothetical protein
MPGLREAESKLARVGPTTPKRASRLADASVDPTEARKLAGFRLDLRVVRSRGNRASWSRVV